MAAKKTDLDVELERLYHSPLGDFTKVRNDLTKQLKKLGKGEEANRVKGLAKPTPSAWAVNVLFDREPEKMETLLAAGARARAGQREAVSGRGAEALRESLGAVRRLIEEMRRRGAAVLAESGRSVSRTMIERIGTNLQSLALSPAAAEEARRGWLDRDLDPPGFEVLAGLQLAGAPVVDMAARRAEREKREAAKPAPARKAAKPVKSAPVVHLPKPKGETERERKERERREEIERARQEREVERVRRRIEVAEEKVERVRNEADSLREEAEAAEKTAAEARRRAEAAELAAGRAREKADRAGERLARAEQELKDASEGG
jgi:flagellar biosynthesis GTPase FlhF